MGTADAEERSDAAPEFRGIDRLMMRYSRWRRRRLTSLTEVPLATLGLQTLYLCVCIAADGILLPWAVTAVAGGFSLLVFAALFVPAAVVEVLVYRGMKAQTPGKA